MDKRFLVSGLCLLLATSPILLTVQAQEGIDSPTNGTGFLDLVDPLGANGPMAALGLDGSGGPLDGIPDFSALNAMGLPIDVPALAAAAQTGDIPTFLGPAGVGGSLPDLLDLGAGPLGIQGLGGCSPDLMGLLDGATLRLQSTLDCLLPSLGPATTGGLAASMIRLAAEGEHPCMAFLEVEALALNPILPPHASTTIIGTEGDDLIIGTSANEFIDGLGGDDIICGGGGRDTIEGGDGNDLIFGEIIIAEGRGVFRGDPKTLRGGAGDDTIIGTFILASDLVEVGGVPPVEGIGTAEDQQIFQFPAHVIEGGPGTNTLIADLGIGGTGNTNQFGSRSILDGRFDEPEVLGAASSDNTMVGGIFVDLGGRANIRGGSYTAFGGPGVNQFVGSIALAVDAALIEEEIEQVNPATLRFTGGRTTMEGGGTDDTVIFEAIVALGFSGHVRGGQGTFNAGSGDSDVIGLFVIAGNEELVGLGGLSALPSGSYGDLTVMGPRNVVTGGEGDETVIGEYLIAIGYNMRYSGGRLLCDLGDGADTCIGQVALSLGGSQNLRFGFIDARLGEGAIGVLGALGYGISGITSLSVADEGSLDMHPVRIMGATTRVTLSGSEPALWCGGDLLTAVGSRVDVRPRTLQCQGANLPDELVGDFTIAIATEDLRASASRVRAAFDERASASDSIGVGSFQILIGIPVEELELELASLGEPPARPLRMTRAGGSFDLRVGDITGPGEMLASTSVPRIELVGELVVASNTGGPANLAGGRHFISTGDVSGASIVIVGSLLVGANEAGERQDLRLRSSSARITTGDFDGDLGGRTIVGELASALSLGGSKPLVNGGRQTVQVGDGGATIIGSYLTAGSPNPVSIRGGGGAIALGDRDVTAVVIGEVLFGIYAEPSGILSLGGLAAIAEEEDEIPAGSTLYGGNWRIRLGDDLEPEAPIELDSQELIHLPQRILTGQSAVIGGLLLGTSGEDTLRGGGYTIDTGAGAQAILGEAIFGDDGDDFLQGGRVTINAGDDDDDVVGSYLNGDGLDSGLESFDTGRLGQVRIGSTSGDNRLFGIMVENVLIVEPDSGEFSEDLTIQEITGRGAQLRGGTGDDLLECGIGDGSRADGGTGGGLAIGCDFVRNADVPA